MLTYLLFVLGFVALVKGADLLVAGASAVAKRFAVSDLVIGLTVVAFGTSTPELFVNVFASAQGRTEIAVGNVLGSNIANILLILGVSALIYPLAIAALTVKREIPLSLLAALVLGVLANDWLAARGGNPSLGRLDGVILLLLFSVFLYLSFKNSRGVIEPDESLEIRDQTLGRSLVWIVVGLAGLTVGAKWIVDGAVSIAGRLGLSESLIGLTVVAVGTSLPELAASAVAAYRRNVDIAVGNVVGSNIFNILFVLGVSSLIRPLPYAIPSNLDLGVVVVSTLLLLLSMLTGRHRSIDRWEGGLFLVLYAGYITYLVLAH